MDISYEFVLEWDDFPENFLERWEEEIRRTEGCDNGVIITIHADYTPGCPGRYTGRPDAMYPAEDPEVEICGTEIRVRRDPNFMDRPLVDEFLSVALQYASDWLEINGEMIQERILEKGHATHQDEIAEILHDLEAAADARRALDRENALMADGEAADWAADRMSAPDERG